MGKFVLAIVCTQISAEYDIKFQNFSNTQWLNTDITEQMGRLCNFDHWIMRNYLNFSEILWRNFHNNYQIRVDLGVLEMLEWPEEIFSAITLNLGSEYILLEILPLGCLMRLRCKSNYFQENETHFVRMVVLTWNATILVRMLMARRRDCGPCDNANVNGDIETAERTS